jgi:hypothetical protein
MAKRKNGSRIVAFGTLIFLAEHGTLKDSTQAFERTGPNEEGQGLGFFPGAVF